MELEVLEGAARTLTDFRPILLVEAIKVDRTKLLATLKTHDYKVFEAGLNFLAVHHSDPPLKCINLAE